MYWYYVCGKYLSTSIPSECARRHSVFLIRRRRLEAVEGGRRRNVGTYQGQRGIL